MLYPLRISYTAPFFPRLFFAATATTNATTTAATTTATATARTATATIESEKRRYGSVVG